MLNKFDMLDCHPSPTPSVHGEVLCRDDGSILLDLVIQIGEVVLMTISLHLEIVSLLTLVLITWSAKKQSIVAFLSTEAEYVAVTSVGTQALWLRNFLEEIGEK